MLILLIAAIATIALGVGLGATPVLNDLLHINWLWIIPVGGLIVGAVMGFMQFGIYRISNAKPGNGSILLLSLAASVGLFSTYIGIWAFAPVDIEGQQFLLRDIVSFREFMDVALAESSYEGRGDSDTTFGRTGTTLLFLGDIIGAGLAGFLVWRWATSHYPYCENCTVWMKTDESLEYFVPGEEESFNTAIQDLKTADESGGYRGLLQHFRDRQGSEKIKKQTFVFHLRHLFCPSCRSALLIGGIDAINKSGNRNTLDDTGFVSGADSGGHFPKAIGS